MTHVHLYFSVWYAEAVENLQQRKRFRVIQGHSMLFLLTGIVNSDGKASLTRQKSPETTTDTRDVSKFY